MKDAKTDAKFAESFTFRVEKSMLDGNQEV